MLIDNLDLIDIRMCLMLMVGFFVFITNFVVGYKGMVGRTI